MGRVGTSVAAITATRPDARTIWEFFRGYRGDDRVVRLRNSFAVGLLSSGCSGVMISPHLYLTAAHCNGPGWTGFVQFFRIDEDAPTPGAAAQQLSERYSATAFPWQSWESPRGGGDTNLWWVEDGSDGIPPGIKYGYLEFATDPIKAGEAIYSLWCNPVDSFNGSPLGTTILHSTGTVGDEIQNWYGPGQNFNLWTAGGASGSAIIRPDGAVPHGIVGVTSGGPPGVPEGSPRNGSRTLEYLRLYDNPTNRRYRNQVLDAVEYDWLFTRAARDFHLLQFDTPARRALWLIGPPFDDRGTFGEIRQRSGVWVGRIANRSTDPVDGLWHAAARFAGGATYRVSAVVRGTPGDACVKFRTDRGNSEVSFSFRVERDWQRVTGRVTLGSQPDYRPILGVEARHAIDFTEVTVARDGGEVGFETAEERRSWEYSGNSFVTSWGIDGASSFGAVVVGPPPGQGWGIRNRYAGLAPNQRYEVTFRSRHVAGALSLRPSIRIQDLAARVAAEESWAYATIGQVQNHTMQFRTDDGLHTVTFGVPGALTFMVDRVRIRRL